MIYNDSFLNKLQKQKIQKKYAKITLLDWGERPVRSLEGEITGGNLNIDGNSAIRTTISLSMIVKDLDLTKYTIALRSKVSIEIGLKNDIDNSYPEIIWFKQGIFIVTNFNTSIGIAQSTISISGKDKMCLLNGEISGSIPASTDFGQVDFYENVYAEIPTENYSPEKYYYKESIDNKDFYFLDYSPAAITGRTYYEKISSITTTKLTIKEIIHNIVYIWGHEAKTRIIINDLDLMGNELLEYRGETPMFLIKQADTNSNIFRNLVFDNNYVIDGDALSNWKDDEFYNLNALDNQYNKVRKFKLDDDIEYVVIKVEYGETIGYRATDLTFAGDLIAAPGESVTSILDKIKNMLGNFEYFYDVNGNFIFQAKHAYELVNYNKFLTDGNNEVYLDGSYYNNKIIYTFNDEEETTQISHTPNLTNLRNDYSIWGEKTSSSGAKIPIHLRYALQKKPELYLTIGDGPRSGLILKTKASNNNELQKSEEVLQQAYHNQVDLNTNIQKAKDDFAEEKNTLESEIAALRFNKTKSSTGSIKRILEVIKYRHLAKWQGSNGSEGYTGIGIDTVFKDAKNKKTDWIETFAQKHDLIVENAYGQFLKIADLIYNDLANNLIDVNQLPFTEEVIETAIQSVDSFNPNDISLYSEDSELYNSLIALGINPNRKGINLHKAFIWGGLFKIDYDFDTSIVLREYQNNWDFAYYHIYNEIMNEYENAISEYQQKLIESLQNKEYDIAVINVIKIWQLKNYQLYIKSFGEIDRSLKYNAESDDTDPVTGEDIYNDEDYSYLKLGLGYNFGKERPDYDTFMETKKGYFLDYWLILNKERFNIFTNIKNIFSVIKDLLLSLEEAQYNLADELHQYELNYYTNMNNLIKTVKENQIPLIVDWRELIYQMSRDFYDYGENSKYNYLSMLINKNQTMLYDDYSTGYEPFYTDLISNWRYLYYNPLLESFEYDIKSATGNTIEEYNKNNYWLISIQKYPSTINFWFDLTEGQEGLNEYTISRVGDRLKTVKDSAVTAIYYKDTPNILYMDDDFKYITTENYNVNSYSYFQLGGELSNLYTISSQGKSAFDELQDLLYKFTYCTENITITSLPIYTLKPNYRIMIQSKTPGLTGEFIINRISIPLLYNGTMSINATKAVPYLGIN